MKLQPQALFSQESSATPGFARSSFADLAASSDAGGRGVTWHRRSLHLAAGLLALALLALALFATSASADERIGGPNEYPDYFGPGGMSAAKGLAVSKREGGDIYVLNGGALQRVDQFEPDGTFVRAFGWGVRDGANELQTCTPVTGCQSGITGSGPGQLSGSDEIAVDNSCAQHEPPLTPTSSPETCEEFDPSYGDVYVVDQQNFRVERYSPEGEFELMFGGEVDTGPHHPGNLCTAAYIAEGDACGPGVSGTAPGFFTYISGVQGWSQDGQNSIAIGPDGMVYVGDFRRVQEFTPEGATGLTYSGQLELPRAQMISSLAVDSESQVFANSLAAANVQEFVPPLPNGNYELCFKGECTHPLNNEVDDRPQIREALEELSAIGTDGVSVAGGVNGYAVTFRGSLATAEIPLLSISTGTVEWLEHGAAPQLVKLAGPKAVSPSEVLVTYDEGGEPTHIALDQAGDLFVADQNGSGAEPPTGTFRFFAFKPTGTLYAEFTSDQVTASSFGLTGPANIAIGDAAGKLYATSEAPEGAHIAAIPLPAEGPATVKEESVSDVEPTTATLHGVVNPQGFDTEYHFQYINDEKFHEDGETFGAGTGTTTSSDLGLVIQDDPVQAAISGLSPETLYHWRAVAESAEGTVFGAAQTFKTLESVSVKEFTTQTVGPDRVEFKASLNPNGSAGTYTIEYGLNTNYSGGSSSGSLPISNEFESVVASFTGLRTNTEYHYRLVAENENGDTETPDQTFTTEPSVNEERAAESCPNTNLREENNSLALPDCRAYEKTTPSDKRGGSAAQFLGFGLAPSGDRVLFDSQGSFAGNTQNELTSLYLAQRSPEGWSTRATVKRVEPPQYQPGANTFYSSELDHWLYFELEGLTASEALSAAHRSWFTEGNADATYVPQATPTLEPLEGGARFAFDFMNIVATSKDYSRIFIGTKSRLLPSPEDERGDSHSAELPEEDRIYEISGVGAPNPAMKLVAEVPLGLHAPSCRIDSKYSYGREVNGHERLATDSGETIAYTAPVEEAAGEECGEGAPNPIGVFARTGDAKPIELNVPPPSQCHSPSPCASAAPAQPLYDGIAADGSTVWFTTTQPLIDQDTDSTNDLYEAKLGPGGELEELVLASAGEATSTHTPGSGAEVGEDGIDEGSERTNQGVVRVSSDGSHVAFESGAVLTEVPNGNGQEAVAGANNIYVYDAQTGQTKFVAEVCSGPGLSGTKKVSRPQNGHLLQKDEAVPDAACPSSLGSFFPGQDSDLWEHGNAPAVFTPNGHYLLFSSYARLTPDDTDDVPDLFRYDFESGDLVRVSKGRNGNDGNGNDNAFPAEFAGDTANAQNGLETEPFAEMSGRSTSTDGSTVIFRTAAPLTSHDTNGKADVYEWEQQGHGTCDEAGGCVRLISDGVDPHGTSDAVIGSSGESIAFSNYRNLIPEDTDGVRDIYVARTDGGFRNSRPEPSCGSSEVCRSGGTGTRSETTIGTESFAGPGNTEAFLKCARGRKRVVRHGQPRCVKKNHLKKRHHSRHHKRRHHLRAVGNRRGDK